MTQFPRSLAIFVIALALLRTPSALAQVVISEFMAQNVNSSVVDEDGEHSDWLELQNTGSTVANLNGWYLTDDSGDLHKWRFPVASPAVNLAPGARLVVWCSNKNRKAAANKLHTNFSLNASGEYLGLIRSDGFTVEYAYAPKYPPQFNNSVYGLASTTTQQELMGDSAPGFAKVATSATDFTTNFAGWNSSATFDTSTWQSGQSGFGFDITNPAQNLIGPLVSATGNVQSMMSGINASCFVRYLVNVPTPSSIASLVLKMKYDDGYIAYLNGTQIASSLAPGGPSWNSTALIDRSDGQAVNFETASLPANVQTLLVPGNNVLAFQMLNISASDPTALLRPQLLANVISGTSTGYLASATPNAANSTLVTNFGPAISGVTDQPAQPAPGPVSLVISAKVVPTLRPLAASNPVVLKYRIMYGAEAAVVMFDDGPAGGHGDAVAGDSIYSGIINTTLVAGQMLRWRIEAKDNNIPATYSYEPPYPFSTTSPPGNPPTVTFAADMDQYFGTVATDTSLASSRVPVLQWFTNDPANTRTSTGASCSFYFLGRFYDNVVVDLHGQSSAGFPVNKKSHNLNFTKINRFKWKEGESSVRSVNLLTNYADKTKLRNGLAWRAWEFSGHIMSHWWQPVRVQQNGAFWGLYDMVEDGNEDMLERYGYNGFDALYKVYDTMDSTSSAEQKTREDIDTSKSDYQAMLNGLVTSLPIATRRLYGYDNIDIPAIVNALAVHALINNNDWGHKNYYMFRNTTGTGEWSLLPWDQDLSAGHTWVSAQSYFSDEIDSQRSIRNGSVPRLKQLVYDSPEMNRMFVRRMRSLMDEALVSGTSTTGWYETQISQLLDQLDPPASEIGAGVKSDQQLDFEKWGFWVHGSGTAIPYTDSRAADYTIRKQAARLTTANPIPPYTGFAMGSAQGTNTTWTFLEGRRRYLYNLNNQNPASGADPIPTAQPAVPTGLTIEVVDYNPGNPAQEYFIIKNASGAYVDVSGWKITGPGGATSGVVDYVFRGGTVIPPFTSGSSYTASGDVHAGRLHVARNPAAFRARTTSPKGGEYRLVVGPYDGRLSARGGTIELRNKANQLVTSSTWAANPTAAQNFLRVTELNYDPAAPTQAELNALPGVSASDFEFIELLNTGASPLTLTGAQFDKGITFVFPSFTLAAGQRCVVVANQTAFQLRYGSGFNIAGEFEGNFDNSGETVRLLDAVGEEVLQFTYDPSWFPPAHGDGYSLVTRTNTPAYDGYDNPQNWAIGGAPGGTPGAGDTSTSNVYEGWRWDYFTQAEMTAGTITGAANDADNDGSMNLHAYAFGGNPRTGGGYTQPTAKVVNVDGVDYPAVEFTRRKNALDLTYQVEVKSDLNALGGWIVTSQQVGSPVDLGNGLERVTYRDSSPVGAPRYFHVRAMK